MQDGELLLNMEDFEEAPQGGQKKQRSNSRERVLY